MLAIDFDLAGDIQLGTSIFEKRREINIMDLIRG